MKTLLFAAIAAPNLPAIKSQLLEVQSFIDGLELRLDYFEEIDLAALKGVLKNTPSPVMFTLRRVDQGGAFQGTEEQRLKLLEALCALEPAYLDLEYDVPHAFREKLFKSHPHVQFVSSYHDFDKT